MLSIYTTKNVVIDDELVNEWICVIFRVPKDLLDRLVHLEM
jgi:hypothetical protein